MLLAVRDEAAVPIRVQDLTLRSFSVSRIQILREKSFLLVNMAVGVNRFETGSHHFLLLPENDAVVENRRPPCVR